MAAGALWGVGTTGEWLVEKENLALFASRGVAPAPQGVCRLEENVCIEVGFQMGWDGMGPTVAWGRGRQEHFVLF